MFRVRRCLYYVFVLDGFVFEVVLLWLRLVFMTRVFHFLSRESSLPWNIFLHLVDTSAASNFGRLYPPLPPCGPV